MGWVWSRSEKIMKKKLFIYVNDFFLNLVHMLGLFKKDDFMKFTETELSTYVNDCFSNLVKRFGLNKTDEIYSEHEYLIEYSSKFFKIKIEKYHRTFDAALYKIGNNEAGIDLFNLLGYLHKNEANIPESNYFENETDLIVCFKKQITHITTLLSENFETINEFFSFGDYNSKRKDLKNFLIEKYPEMATVFGKK
jgi:hypothetical protein